MISCNNELTDRYTALCGKWVKYQLFGFEKEPFYGKWVKLNACRFSSNEEGKNNGFHFLVEPNEYFSHATLVSPINEFHESCFDLNNPMDYNPDELPKLDYGKNQEAYMGGIIEGFRLSRELDRQVEKSDNDAERNEFVATGEVISADTFAIGERVYIAQGTQVLKAGYYAIVMQVSADEVLVAPTSMEAFTTTAGELMVNHNGFFCQWIPRVNLAKVATIEEAGKAGAIEFENDPISPSHYKQGDKEVWEMMIDIYGKEAFIHFARLSAFKYRMRAGYKDGIEQDIKKALRFENKIKELQNQ